jgi:hypothetical protein
VLRLVPFGVLLVRPQHANRSPGCYYSSLELSIPSPSLLSSLQVDAAIKSPSTSSSYLSSSSSSAPAITKLSDSRYTSHLRTAASRQRTPGAVSTLHLRVTSAARSRMEGHRPSPSLPMLEHISSSNTTSSSGSFSSPGRAPAFSNVDWWARAHLLPPFIISTSCIFLCLHPID